MILPINESDPMLDAMDAAQEAAQTGEKRRPYLGMSSLGNECSRQLFYGFRWVKVQTFEAQTLRYFEDGHRTEDLVADRINAVKGVTLQTQDEHDPTRQIGWRDCGGHVRGHADGILTGLIQAPKTRHLWENKAVNDKKFAKLEKLKAINEKSALFLWDEIYYGQQVLYMDYEGLTRSWMTVTTPGGRRQLGVRTEADPAHAMKLKEKARKIVFSDYAPDPVSTVDKAPPCLWCPFKDICRGKALPDRNCRTCIHVTAEKDGTWSCARKNKTLSYDEQTDGCEDQRYHPTFVAGDISDGSHKDNWVLYDMKDGSTWRDEG